MKEKLLPFGLLLVPIVAVIVTVMQLRIPEYFFGTETTGHITKVYKTNPQAMENHSFTHIDIEFDTPQGKVRDTYVADFTSFTPGPIKVKYLSGFPENYLFTDSNSSYWKYFGEEIEGNIAMIFTSILLSVLCTLVALKMLGYDIVGKFIIKAAQ